MDAKTLDGRVAVVSGGSRGLGKAIGESLGSAGASVALVSRDMNALNSAATEVRRTGADVEIFQADPHGGKTGGSGKA